jgi:tRNA dimethylallyltransferase
MTSSAKKKVYFIIGPTGSGKTTLSIELAKKIKNSEIISADSRQIFRDFDLSSGKVTQEEMENIPHHMLSIINPGEYFSVVDFTNLATKIIEEIFERGNTPIVVGGTGFYIDSLLYKYNLPEVKSNFRLRKDLEEKSLEELFEFIKSKDPVYAEIIVDNFETRNNKHRMIRTVEIVESLGKFPQLNKEKRYDKDIFEVEIIKTNIERDNLREKVLKRIMVRLDAGMIEEIKNAKKKYNLSFEYLESLGLEFKWLSKFLKGDISKEEMIENLYTETCQYAKRQDTWFRRYTNF